MWLCVMRRDSLTNQRTDLVHSIYKLLWSFWKTKYFCIIVLHDCVLNQQHPPPKAVTAFIVLCMLSEAQVIYILYEYDYIQWLLLYS